MVSGTVSTILSITKQQPGLWVVIESVEYIFSTASDKSNWGASFDPLERNADGSSVPIVNREISPALAHGVIGKVSLWTPDWDVDPSFYRNIGPTVRFHMVTGSRGNRCGPKNEVVSDVRFTMDITTSSWPILLGMPDTIFLTIQFQGNDTAFKYSFENSNITGARDIQLGLILNQNNQVSITAEATKNGTLDFIDGLTKGVLVTDAAIGIWAVAEIGGPKTVIDMGTHAIKALGPEQSALEQAKDEWMADMGKGLRASLMS